LSEDWEFPFLPLYGPLKAVSGEESS
jgi:hypothetical protein